MNFKKLNLESTNKQIIKYLKNQKKTRYKDNNNIKNIKSKIIIIIRIIILIIIIIILIIITIIIIISIQL